MRLTTFSDYTLRVLVHLARHPDRFVTIQEIASAHAISANHLMKVAHQLGTSGDVQTLRGPRGGLRLARPAGSIRIGDVIRRTQPDCVQAPINGVTVSLLAKATAAFMAVLDSHTLADIVTQEIAEAPISEPAGHAADTQNSRAAPATKPNVGGRVGSTHAPGTEKHEEDGNSAA